MTILCYHSVEAGWNSPLAVSPDAFRRHCEWLAVRRRVVPLADAVRLLTPSGALPGRATALTFDDGFAAVFEHAFPVLSMHRLPATFFVVAGTLTEELAVTWVDTPPSSPLRTLSLAQIREMRDQGMAFGSHSHAHHDLTELSEEECERDLRISRQTLEDLLERPVPFLAYPRGRHDERVRRAAQRAGFTHAFTLPEAPEPIGPYAVPRAGVFPGNGVGSLRLKTSPWYLRIRTGRAYPFVRLAVKGRRPPGRHPG